MLLGTVASTKAYLGVGLDPWDPIVAGVIMTGAAVGVRRWLAAGSGGDRAGLTAARLHADEVDAIDLLGTVSLTVQPHPSLPPAGPPETFGGGRSGGAGAGGEY